tara:strand:- start:1764 stop:1988 length:225 start_codon:yes stop_codon:yes gene_type:complete
MFALITWESITGPWTVREGLPFAFAMSMARDGGFARAQVIDEHDQIMAEFKAGGIFLPRTRKKINLNPLTRRRG